MVAKLMKSRSLLRTALTVTLCSALSSVVYSQSQETSAAEPAALSREPTMVERKQRCETFFHLPFGPLSECRTAVVGTAVGTVVATGALQWWKRGFSSHMTRINEGGFGRETYTGGVDKPYIVVHSGVLEGLEDAQLQYVLGHELGHIMAGHVPYRIVAENIRMLLVGLVWSVVPVPGLAFILNNTILMGLMAWYRKAGML